MKGRLSASNVHHLFGSLCQELQEHIKDLGPEGTEELKDMVRHIMFPTITSVLFGKDILLTNKKTTKELEEHFQNFDDGFEYGSQLPEYFLKKWSTSKTWLLQKFEQVLSAEGTNSSDSHSKTLLQHVLDHLYERRFGANYALLLLWASQANAIPVSFWTLAFILSHPSIYENVMKELESVYGKPGKENIAIHVDDLKKLQFIKWCILESTRLRAPGGITKKVVNPIKVQNFVIPAGDLLMLSPYWIHRNPKYFPEPQLFKPDRWKEENLEKNSFLEGFVAFGAGAHQCPGRWLAIMEIQILVVLFLYKYECKLLDPLPKESLLHLVGIQQPAGPCRVQYKRRI
ncbi:24-hydroxycholesterol 7-alpha-hydroxylase isoform X2 [Hemicordylus capensis]|nr:24-hydroxycholesterol 7-alpha-hydroxylase isoform X2 [Hemicordylus capensis]